MSKYSPHNVLNVCSAIVIIHVMVHEYALLYLNFIRVGLGTYMYE